MTSEEWKKPSRWITVASDGVGTYTTLNYDDIPDIEVLPEFENIKTLEDIDKNQEMLNWVIRSPTGRFFSIDYETKVFYRDKKDRVIWAVNEHGQVHDVDDKSVILEDTIPRFLSRIHMENNIWYKLNVTKEPLTKKERTYMGPKDIVMISGHLDISQEDWETHYKQEIDDAIETGASFLLGDARGTDQMSAEYLENNNIPRDRVTIYHLGDNPRYDTPFPTRGGYKTLTQRDAAMTLASHRDIAWVRSAEESKKLYGAKYNPRRVSGTQKNLNRRQRMSE
jgi:hypothetical protein